MRIGILGGGQLGRMLALAGYPLGHTFTFLDKSADAPMAPLAKGIVADYTDSTAVESLAQNSDVVTWEFENVGGSAPASIAKFTPIFPTPRALQIKEDRLNEKQFFCSLGIPTADFMDASTPGGLRDAIAKIGLPVVLKARRLGYDGKGQTVIHNDSEIENALRNIGSVPVIVEKLIPFERELSIISVRDKIGNIIYYPIGENVHRTGILRWSIAPAPLPNPAILKQATDAARNVLEELNYVGVLAIEFFEVKGRLLANEFAPRVHNSGHWTMDGAETSQFENHIRAITGMPLGGTAVRSRTAMINIIGDVPDIRPIMSIPGLHLHLYGKQPRDGRKVGHVNLCQWDTPAREFDDRIRSMHSIFRTG
ncbi:MAG: 5-(carboxyamino)imidazole ribonucleotide synthase [Planctomycetes bacterium]|nr:5-(carboxyamino)imidazole ribonucleotide synthase [Planctomycetota bacterium]